MTDGHKIKYSIVMGINERKEREKEQRKNDIIDAAEKLFFEKGINNVSMEDVAKEAELSKGTLYLYFNGKEELHWAIMQRGFFIMGNKMHDAIDSKKTGYENLIAIGRAFIEFTAEEKNYFDAILFFEGKDFNNLKMDPCFFEEFFENSPVKLLYQQVERGMQDGSIRSDLSTNAMATTLWAQTLGLMQVMTKKHEVFEIYKMSQEDLVQSHLEILTNGIKK